MLEFVAGLVLFLVLVLVLALQALSALEAVLAAAGAELSALRRAVAAAEAAGLQSPVLARVTALLADREREAIAEVGALAGSLLPFCVITAGSLCLFCRFFVTMCVCVCLPNALRRPLCSCTIDSHV